MPLRFLDTKPREKDLQKFLVAVSKEQQPHASKWQDRTPRPGGWLQLSWME
jgi:hypothetical protein